MSEYVQLLLGETTNKSLELKDYLSSGDIDPERNGYLIPNWAKDSGLDLPDDITYDELSDEEQDQFRDWLDQNYDKEVSPSEQDANLFYDKISLVDSGQWLVHFTDPVSARLITQQGFQYGTPKDVMHNTKYRDRGHDPYGDWAFAYVATSPDADYASRVARYGTTAVMFKSSAAVKAYHYGDNEDQVIFDKDAKVRDTVRLRRVGKDGSEWYIGNDYHPLYRGTFAKAINWVVDNYGTYHHVLGRYRVGDPYREKIDRKRFGSTGHN